MERTLSSNRLLLKTVDQGHANSVLQFYSENKLSFEPWEPLKPPHFYTLSYQRSLITAERNLYSRSQAVRFFLYLKESPKQIIGSVNFYHIMRTPDNSCKLGYKLAATAMHHGYAQEALNVLIPIVMDKYHIYRIEADIMPSNTDSIRLIKRLGFQEEGILRKNCEINGIREDHLRFSFLKSDIQEQNL